MTILFFSPYFYPHIGGVEKHAFEVAKILKKKGYKIIVFTEGEIDKRRRVNGIEVQEFFFGRNDWLRKFRIWLKIYKYRKLIKNSDIVHCHDVFFWYLPFKFIYPQKKVFITFHGFENVPPTKREIFIRKFSEIIVNGNLIVGHYIEKWFGTKPNSVLYGGVAKFYKSKQRFTSSKPRILLIGRLDKDIGIKTYIESLRLIKDYSLDVCGDGPFRATLEKYGNVHGFVADIHNYLLRSDLVFASSYLSIMEALAFKKPVFAVYENRLKRDYLRLSPLSKFIIIEKSPKLLGDKVKLLNKQRNIQLLTDEGFDWVKKQTWDNIAKEYLKLWNVLS